MALSGPGHVSNMFSVSSRPRRRPAWIAEAVAADMTDRKGALKEHRHPRRRHKGLVAQRTQQFPGNLQGNELNSKLARHSWAPPEGNESSRKKIGHQAVAHQAKTDTATVAPSFPPNRQAASAHSYPVKARPRPFAGGASVPIPGT